MEHAVHVNNEERFGEGAPAAGRPRTLKRKLGGGGESDLQLDVAMPMGRPTAGLPSLDAAALGVPLFGQNITQFLDLPFMSNMDEITYWIYTKRAPCLMSYDMLKKQEEAQGLKIKPRSVHITAEDTVPSPKKRKRKICPDDSDSTGMQQNVYFDVSKHKQTVPSCKSSSLVSDVDFNIKNSSLQEKSPKKMKGQKNRTVMHKKNKVITSTPKVTSKLRRSVRNVQNNVINNSQIDTSFEILDTNLTNGVNVKSNGKPVDKSRKSVKIADKVQIIDNKNNIQLNNQSDRKNLLNGGFEDLSDVSGFTANYIRSTKLNSTRNSRNLRSKNNRALVKESQNESKQGNSMLICLNKSVNTGLPKTLNCSTDSSQNVINLVTVKNNNKTPKVNQSTSLLKFVDVSSKSKESLPNSKQNGSKRVSKSNQNSLEIVTNTSRYPKRSRNQYVNKRSDLARNLDKQRKNSSDFNNSDRKENPEEQSLSRTRSGRSIGLAVRQPDNSVLVVSNSTEQMSSMVTMNIASTRNTSARKQKGSTRARVKKIADKSESLRDSQREKSGFAACFSDSDDASEVRPRKYFC